ncbi:MAG: Flp pilus assembly complex ATPase component TadA [Clostridia bacterium]|nr:Flp pilus assembly complex ATPase component TadA [Clostridia bacterium]
MITKQTRFDTALYPLPEKLRSTLSTLPVYIKEMAQEIRLRAERPVCITAMGNLYVTKDGKIEKTPVQNALKIDSKELYEVLISLTNHSVYTRVEELREGYVSMKGGHRAGVCGQFTEGFFKNVSSINIRIAKEIDKVATPLYTKTDGGLLIVGSAGSGKTTVLRDLVKYLSETGKRISLIDTRGEIAACEKGVPTLNVGVNTDIICTKDKARGAEIALRTMFPQIICFDEIGTEAELKSVSECFNAGVEIITTAHASSIYEIRNRRVTSKLLQTGAIKNIALLSLKNELKIELIDIQEVKNFAMA